MRSQYRLLIGLVLAAALAWGASPDLRATAKAAADATAKAAVKAATPAKPATPATPTTAAKPTAKATTPATAAPAPAPQKVTVAQGPVTVQDKLAKKANKIMPSDKKAAAARAAALGLKPGVAGGGVVAFAAAAPLPPLNGINQGPGGTPHYFGPYANYANSPLPTADLNVALTVDSGGTGYTAPVVTITDAYDATKSDIASATVVGGVITVITTAGTGYSAPVVTITDATGTGAAATATLNPATIVAGTGIRKFIDKLPGLGPTGANALGQYIPVAQADTTSYAGSDYYEIALVQYTEKMHSDLPPTTLRGYVQLATANVAGSTALGVNKPDGNPAFGVDKPHYLGPAIVASSNRPVRIKFYNLLPTGAGGNLFIPVDETVAGAGLGPAGPGIANSKYTQNRADIHLHGNNTVWISDGTPHQWITPANETTPYPKGVSVFNVPDMPNPGRPPVPPAVDPAAGTETIYYTNAMSARLMFYHDHAMGITRLNVYAGEAAGYVITDQVDQDMINGTNLSGVNIATGTSTPFKKVLPDIGFPLVIQDRTFVDANTIFAQDPTWNWGTGLRDATTGNITGAVTGDLWYPHVYMSAQNPWDLAGANAFGRFHYGPWFINQTPTCVNGLPLGCIDVGPVPNPYHQPDCDLVPPGPGCTAPWEPPLMPGTPNPSMPGEAFVDTPIVNGTAYPYMEVEPRAYRFRVLNASNDRFVNLQLYKAFDKTSWLPGIPPATPTSQWVPGTPTSPCGATITDCTEVKMVPVSTFPANQQADWPSGVPDQTPALKGPDWWQIGTEGGFLPAPVVVPQQPIGWNLNPTTFNYGNVNQHSLLLGAAERADVVVDFSAYAGQTLILYNDAPAAFPAGVSVYDYYTGVADQTSAGGAPTTLPGYGPNTRTIMQIRVGAAGTGTPTPDVTFANLQAVFAKTATKPGVFEVSQDPIIVPQAAYNSAYNGIFSATAAGQYVQLADFSKTFQPINAAGQLQPAVTIPLEMKAMHDEMGGVYDTQFGRMSGMLGVTLPSGTGVLAPYGYAAPPTDIHVGSVEGTLVGSFADGTQIWRLFHNGVDTHPIHVHLFNAQLINRVGQDGIMLPPDPTELGWKETFRVNPLEVTYLAMRPTIPNSTQVPFELPDSIRLIDPTLPEGATLNAPPPAGWFTPAGVAIPEILNHYVNFGWEYVWHCHILAHEEMDMMHSLAFAVPPTSPGPALLGPGFTVTFQGNKPTVNLTWVDKSIKEAGFTIQRATDAGFTVGLTAFNVAANTVAYADTSVANNTQYWYRVFAVGATVGDVLTAGFPTATVNSAAITIGPVTVGTPPTAGPAAPTALAATVQAGPQVSLRWTDNANNETGFVVGRCTGVGCGLNAANFAQIATVGPRTNGNSTVTFVDTTVTAGNTYNYRVTAVNSFGTSAPSPTPPAVVSAVVPAIPAAPTNFIVAVAKANGNNYTATLTWASGVNPTNYTIQRATNASFTTGLSTSTVAGNLTTSTQTVSRNTTYYYRVRANNSIGGSSAWTNALPFPIRTGN